MVPVKSPKWPTDFLSCAGSIGLYLCPNSVGTSEGPDHNLHTFCYSAMVQEIGLHSCPMSRGQFSSAHTLMTSGLSRPMHTEVLELKAQGLAIESRQRETTGEKMPGPGYMAWVHESSEINSSLPPFVSFPSTSTYAYVLLEGRHPPLSHSSFLLGRKSVLLERGCMCHPHGDLTLVLCAEMQRLHTVIQWTCKTMVNLARVPSWSL